MTTKQNLKRTWLPPDMLPCRLVSETAFDSTHTTL